MLTFLQSSLGSLPQSGLGNRRDFEETKLKVIFTAMPWRSCAIPKSIIAVSCESYCLDWFFFAKKKKFSHSRYGSHLDLHILPQLDYVPSCWVVLNPRMELQRSFQVILNNSVEMFTLVSIGGGAWVTSGVVEKVGLSLDHRKGRKLKAIEAEADFRGKRAWSSRALRGVLSGFFLQRLETRRWRLCRQISCSITRKFSLDRRYAKLEGWSCLQPWKCVPVRLIASLRRFGCCALSQSFLTHSNSIGEHSGVKVSQSP